MKKNKKKAIIIGAGFGGLALGIRLQAKGYDVTIFEKQDAPGGHAQQIKKNGYTFDIGPSLITYPRLFEELYELAGEKLADKVQLIQLDPAYRVYFHDKSYIDFFHDEKKMQKEIAKFNKEDAKRYPALCKYLLQLHNEVFLKGVGSKPFDSWQQFFAYAPQLVRMNGVIPIIYSLKRYIKDPKLQQAFSFQPLFIGGNPYRDPSIFHAILGLEIAQGDWFAKGGMYTMVQELARLFQKLGGQLSLSAEVEQVLVKEGNAYGIIANRREYEADIIISNAHFAHTYKDLIMEKDRRRWKNSVIEKKEYSFGAFLLCIGVKKQYKQLRHHTIILGKRYKGLIEDIYRKKVLADDFSMYLHIPSISDPSMAPEGAESMYVLIPVPNLSARIDWDKEKDSFSKKVLDFLEHDFGLTDLQKNIEVLEVITPIDFASRRNTYLGSAWTLVPKITQVATFRPHNKSEELKNFYLVGASTHPGPGVPAVIMSAKATEISIDTDARR